MNKFKYSRNQRIFNIYFKKCRKKLWKVLKPILIFILKLFGWLVLLGIIFIITSYDDYGNKPSIWLVFAFYIGIISQHYTDDNNYKNWLERSQYDEFYNRFCEQYQPHIIGYIIMFAIGLKYCNTWGFIVCVLLPYFIDLWDRRYITNNIKQDMILERLKTNQSLTSLQ